MGLLSSLRDLFSCSTWGLVPWPGSEPGPPALGAPQLPDHERSPNISSLKPCSSVEAWSWLFRSINQGHHGPFLSQWKLRMLSSLHRGRPEETVMAPVFLWTWLAVCRAGKVKARVRACGRPGRSAAQVRLSMSGPCAACLMRTQKCFFWKISSRTDIGTSQFIASLFAMSKRRKQPSSMLHQWLNGQTRCSLFCSIHAVE